MLNINIHYDERSLKTWSFSKVLEVQWSINSSSKMTLLYMLLNFLNDSKWFSCSSGLITHKDKEHRIARILIFTFLCAKLIHLQLGRNVSIYPNFRQEHCDQTGVNGNKYWSIIFGLWYL